MTIIQGKNLKLKGEKLKTQAKNSRFRQNQKRGLPKIGRKKKAVLSARSEVGIVHYYLNVICEVVSLLKVLNAFLSSITGEGRAAVH